jgi:hypothetical protein
MEPDLEAAGAAGVTADETVPGDPTSSERIDWIVALEHDPVRRNLLITQCYHDLATALGEALGAENANWCTFATWASRTAGRFVREDEIPKLFHALLGDSEPVDISLARVNNALRRTHPQAGVDHDGVLAAVRGIVHDVAKLITAGNLAVFGELAPIFSKAVGDLGADPEATALDGLCDSLVAGLSEKGGQSMLSSALARYALARSTEDADHKAALMLFANAQVGLHEQIRLQPFIAGSLDAPILDGLYDVVHESGEGLPAHIRHEFRVAMNHMLRPLADETCRLWERFATRELMTLSLPDGTLVLGRDLPNPPNAPLYPGVLDPIVLPEVMEFLVQYGADQPGTPGTAALDWTKLSDRMRFIMDLFRSRQCDRSLQGQPFTPDQQAQMLAGRPVTGSL